MNMKRIIKYLASAIALFAVSSCIANMDPFEGGDGVRANINGQKCVMSGTPGKVYANCSFEDGANSFGTHVEMMHLLDKTNFGLSFSLTDTTPFATGQHYSIGSGTYKATLTTISGEDVPLTGWVTFLKIGVGSKTVEAQFELDGQDTKGDKYAVRHGFMRLYRIKEGE
jgi:hypothetical protein